MKNLAGDPDCDRTIAHELERARIEFVRLDLPSGEVSSRLRGRLGPITFSRGDVHWIAEGPVPLAVAASLYADPIGQHRVRVQGHRNGPAPAPPWIGWYTGEGARVYPVEQQAEFLHLREKWPHMLERMPPVVFHDQPAAIGAHGYIDLYHIDSLAGLQVFASTLRRHGIDQLVRPVWWAWHHPATNDAAAWPSATAMVRAQLEPRAAQWDGDTQELEPSDRTG